MTSMLEDAEASYNNNCAFRVLTLSCPEVLERALLDSRPEVS